MNWTILIGMLSVVTALVSIYTAFFIYQLQSRHEYRVQEQINSMMQWQTLHDSKMSMIREIAEIAAGVQIKISRLRANEVQNIKSFRLDIMHDMWLTYKRLKAFTMLNNVELEEDYPNEIAKCLTSLSSVNSEDTKVNRTKKLKIFTTYHLMLEKFLIQQMRKSQIIPKPLIHKASN